MLKKTSRLLAVMLVITGFALTASADSIVIVNTGTASNTFFPGQSVTIPFGTNWNNLTFNWFDNASPMNPVAAGHLFLLSQEYLGNPVDLSSSTAGFIAESTGIVNGVYQFDPTLLLAGGPQYFFYSDTALLNSGGSGIYGGGDIFYSFDANTGFALSSGTSANFALNGDPAPEPVSMVLIGAGLVGLAVLGRRRRVNR